MKQQRQPQDISEPDIQALVKRLASEDAQEREQAQQELRSVIEHYAQTITEIHDHQARDKAAMYTSLILWPLLLLILAPILKSFFYPVTFLLAGFEYRLIVDASVSVRRRSHNQANLGSQLIELDDVHIIGPLLAVLVGITRSDSSNAPYPDIKNALIRLLPRLKSSDAILFPYQRRHLLVLLKMESSRLDNRVVGADLMVAILRALEQLGDEKALPIVERLAKSAKNLEVRQAAQVCLPFLHQRIEEQRSGQTLLRAASASNAPSEALLRPAAPTPEIEPQKLLRASTAEEKDMPKQ